MSEKNNNVPQYHPESEDISYKFSSLGSGQKSGCKVYTENTHTKL